MKPPPRPVRVLAAVGALVLGLVVGLSSVALHHHWWGLALAVTATSTAAYALPAGWWARMPFAVGWVAMVGYLALPRDEGDYVIADDVPGYVLLGYAVALLVASMVTLQPIRGRNTTLPPSGS
ncbi:MAG: DUF6113 family protein [Nocardioides sp.]